MSSKIWTKILFLLIVVNIGYFIWQNKSIYQQPYNYSYWQDRFDHSQYSQGDKSSYILSDADLNTLRGYLYVEKGIDMEKFIPGHPPLASYLFGLSIAVFNNQFIVSLIFGLISLFLLYKICFLLTKNKFISILTTLVFSLEPIFLSQLNDSMLDIFQMCLGLASIYFFQLWIKDKRTSFLIFSQLFIGFVLSTKFFLSGAPLPIALTIFVVSLNNFKKFKEYILSLPMIGLGFVIGHITYFFYHLSPISFIKYQRYLISWWFGSSQSPPFQVWDMIFNNRWHTWWGNMDILSIDLWRFTWPVVFTIGIFSVFVFAYRKIEPNTYLALYLWLIISLLLYSFESVYPRHLLYVFPTAYILTSLSIIKLRGSK